MRNRLLLFSDSVVSDSLGSHGLQHTRLLCPSLSLGVCSNSCPLSRWCHPPTSSSVIPFSSCPQSFPVTRSFPRNKENSAGYGNCRYKDQCLPCYVWDGAHKWESLDPGLRSRACLESRKVTGKLYLWNLLWLLTGFQGKLFMAVSPWRYSVELPEGKCWGRLLVAGCCWPSGTVGA